MMLENGIQVIHLTAGVNMQNVKQIHQDSGSGGTQFLYYWEKEVNEMLTQTIAIWNIKPKKTQHAKQ